MKSTGRRPLPRRRTADPAGVPRRRWWSSKAAKKARAIELVREAALKAQRGKNWGVFQWTVTEGLLRVDVDLGGAQQNAVAARAAAAAHQGDHHGRHLRAARLPSVSRKPRCSSARSRTSRRTTTKCARTLVLISPRVKLPQELDHLAARFAVKMPDKNERHAIVMRMAREWAQANGAHAADRRQGGREAGRQPRRPARCTTCERLTRQAIFNDGALTEDDLTAAAGGEVPAAESRRHVVVRGGHRAFAEVGGLKNLRRWILQRKAAFDGSAPGLDAPKGVLLLGVQGCGKSLAARAAAGVLGVPLVRLDFGALYSKWHGESEKNLRESLHFGRGARALRVVARRDREGAVQRGDGDSGTSRRVLGAFLTWLAEQRARVFIVATANDITALPPELVRKGRFDEIFFVDLPTPAARLEILGIHCKKRGSRAVRAATCRRSRRAAKDSPARKSSRPWCPRCTPRTPTSRPWMRA